MPLGIRVAPRHGVIAAACRRPGGGAALQSVCPRCRDRSHRGCLLAEAGGCDSLTVVHVLAAILRTCLASGWGKTVPAGLGGFH